MMLKSTLLATEAPVWSLVLGLALLPIQFATTGFSQDVADDTQREVPQESVLVVVGAAGAPEFEEEFAAWADQWQTLASRQSWNLTRIENEKDELSPKEQLKAAIEARSESRRLWIVMLGHGTFGKGVAKFNLSGPDVSAKELSTWLRPVQSEVVVVNCSSSSAPFLTELAAKDRIIVTATKSGSEFNFSRFGKYLSQAVNDPSVDIDHDNEVSLLEAFLAANNGTQRFYSEETRLASEHALINDNGDKVGTTGDFYRGVRPIKESDEGEIDGAIASRIILMASEENAQFPPALDDERRSIERQIDKLRTQKSILQTDTYYDELETLLLKLAAVYDEAEK